MSLLDLSLIFFFTATLIKIVADFEKFMREPSKVQTAKVRHAAPVIRRRPAVRTVAKRYDLSNRTRPVPVSRKVA